MQCIQFAISKPMCFPGCARCPCSAAVPCRNRHLFINLRVQKRTRAWSFGFFAISVVLIFYWRQGRHTGSDEDYCLLAMQSALASLVSCIQSTCSGLQSCAPAMSAIMPTACHVPVQARAAAT